MKERIGHVESPMFLRLGATVLLMAAASGCNIGLSSDAGQVEQAKKTIVSQLVDPSSAQFRGVKASDGWVCGEINGKNKMGAYVGFSRFLVRPDSEEGQIDPEFIQSELRDATDLCQSLRGNEYASSATTASACERSLELRIKEQLQITFDRDWEKNCGRAHPKSSFRPPLNEVPGPVGSE